jgi:rare lipoprotein A
VVFAFKKSAAGLARIRESALVLVAITTALATLAGCSRGGSQRQADTGVSASPRLVREGQTAPRGGGTYKLGKPYQISGRWYVPQDDPNYDRTGLASWYGADFHGRKTANGEIFDMNALTAAHPTLPIPSYASVTNPRNGRTILVRINDRGPYAHDRVLDLSRQSARVLGTEAQGIAEVRVRYVGRAPLDGDTSRETQHLASQPWAGGVASVRSSPRMSLGLSPEALQ